MGRDLWEFSNHFRSIRNSFDRVFITRGCPERDTSQVLLFFPNILFRGVILLN